MFEVIEGRKAAELNKFEERRRIKFEAFRRMFYRKAVYFSTREELKAAIFCGVKYIALAPIDKEEASWHTMMRDVAHLESIMQFLSPNELVEIFPIAKDFDGARFGMKDYYVAKECLSKYAGDVPMMQNLDYILMDYWNDTITSYQVKKFMIVDRIRRMEGKKSMMEEFADMMNVTTYTYDKEEKKMYNNKTGQAFKVEKPMPRNWQVVAGGGSQ